MRAHVINTLAAHGRVDPMVRQGTVTGTVVRERTQTTMGHEYKQVRVKLDNWPRALWFNKCDVEPVE